MEQRPFVLSGGGARGIAHLGVLEAFAEAGVVPSAISGTSAGALLGAFIAAGLTPTECTAVLREEWKLHRTRWKVLRGELLSQRRIGEFLKAYLPCTYFEELRIPLHVSATDLERGGQRIFSSGELIPALLAASAVPVIFPPVVIDGTPYVDGGLSNNLPVEPFLDQRSEVIAVYVNPLPPYDAKRSLRRTLDRTFHLSFREMVMRSAQGCHLYVEPAELAQFGMFDLRRAAEIQRIGYRYTKRLLAQS
ncbi:MAG TPA: patatin-like phospholipase family protein [Flavobacteriales bacterium]|jgi:NTE family protein|nr:patatin-like phospholipase family protein [Flavobacteriales bacterium]